MADDKKKEQKAEVRREFYYSDDYVRTEVISFGHGFPDVTIKFKPINLVQSSNLTDEVIRLEGVKGATEANLAMLAKHIVEWDVVKLDGSAVDPHDVRELGKISPKLMTRISNMVRGDTSNAEQDAKEVESLKNS